MYPIPSGNYPHLHYPRQFPPTGPSRADVIRRYQDSNPESFVAHTIRLHSSPVPYGEYVGTLADIRPGMTNNGTFHPVIANWAGWRDTWRLPYRTDVFYVIVGIDDVIDNTLDTPRVKRQWAIYSVPETEELPGWVTPIRAIEHFDPERHGWWHRPNPGTVAMAQALADAGWCVWKAGHGEVCAVRGDVRTWIFVTYKHHSVHYWIGDVERGLYGDCSTPEAVVSGLSSL